jgi:hypothetical protein
MPDLYQIVLVLNFLSFTNKIIKVNFFDLHQDQIDLVKMDHLSPFDSYKITITFFFF